MAGNIRDGTRRGCFLTCLAGKIFEDGTGRGSKTMSKIVGWTGQDGGCEISRRDGTVQ